MSRVFLALLPTSLKAILEAGLDVPEDIAVVGAGDVHYSDMLRVPLSTINQSSLQIGESSAELLLKNVESNRSTLHKLQIKGEMIAIISIVVESSTEAEVCIATHGRI